jgi:hypothetical protein
VSHNLGINRVDGFPWPQSFLKTPGLNTANQCKGYSIDPIALHIKQDYKKSGKSVSPVSNPWIRGVNPNVALKGSNGKWFYWEWNEIPTIHQDLDQILAQGQEMLERVNRLIESHPDIAVSY